MQSTSRVYTDYERWVKDHDPDAEFGDEPHYGPFHHPHQVSSDTAFNENDPRTNELQQTINKRHHLNIPRSNLQHQDPNNEFLTPTACWAIAIMILAAALIFIRMRMVRAS